MNRPSLLHNMSAPPKSVIEHHAPPPEGRATLFRLPADFRTSDPCAVLTRIDGRTWAGDEKKAEAELRRRLNDHAARLPYPPAVLVTLNAESVDYVDDPLTVCAVLAKSSDRVYLRDKEPNLDHIELRRRIVLQLPEVRKRT
jgi:hypothetical protein